MRKSSFQGKGLEGQHWAVVGRIHLASSRTECEIPQTQTLPLNTGMKDMHTTYMLKKG